MEFYWDEPKELANFNKHGVRFSEAKTCWEDPYSIELYNESHSEDEERFLKLGTSMKGRLLLTVFTEPEDHLHIRIISSRKATYTERKIYEEGI